MRIWVSVMHFSLLFSPAQVTRLCDLSVDGDSVTSVCWNERVSMNSALLALFYREFSHYVWTCSDHFLTRHHPNHYCHTCVCIRFRINLYMNTLLLFIFCSLDHQRHTLNKELKSSVDIRRPGGGLQKTLHFSFKNGQNQPFLLGKFGGCRDP